MGLVKRILGDITNNWLDDSIKVADSIATISEDNETNTTRSSNQIVDWSNQSDNGLAWLKIEVWSWSGYVISYDQNWTHPYEKVKG